MCDSQKIVLKHLQYLLQLFTPLTSLIRLLKKFLNTITYFKLKVSEFVFSRDGISAMAPGILC